VLCFYENDVRSVERSIQEKIENLRNVKAIILPLHRINDKRDCKNYSGMSLLNVRGNWEKQQQDSCKKRANYNKNQLFV